MPCRIGLPCLSLRSPIAPRVTLVSYTRSKHVYSLGPQFVQVGLYMYIFDFHRDAWGKVRGVTVSMPEANSVAYYVRE